MSNFYVIEVTHGGRTLGYDEYDSPLGWATAEQDCGDPAGMDLEGDALIEWATGLYEAVYFAPSRTELARLRAYCPDAPFGKVCTRLLGDAEEVETLPDVPSRRDRLAEQIMMIVIPLPFIPAGDKAEYAYKLADDLIAEGATND